MPGILLFASHYSLFCHYTSPSGSSVSPRSSPACGFVFTLLTVLHLLLSYAHSASTIAGNKRSKECRLPSDFWCDHPDVEVECTGGYHYCHAYRRERKARGVVADMALAFETACPDSQKFIVHRLYPNVLSRGEYSTLVDVKTVPWGLAKRMPDQQVKCHHGERECMGNRWLTCALLYYKHDSYRRHALLYCYMAYMQHKGDPWMGMDSCLDSLYTPQLAKESIFACGMNEHGSHLQWADELETAKIFPAKTRVKHFVPFISINGRGHVHMQAYQLILAEKLRSWNATLNNARNHAGGKRVHDYSSSPSTTNSVQQSAAGKSSGGGGSLCYSPPDFWCSDPSITAECFTLHGCGTFLRRIYGQPLELRLFYNPLEAEARSYLLRYIRPYLLSNLYGPTALGQGNAVAAGKYSLELVPMASSSLSRPPFYSPNGTFEGCVYGSRVLWERSGESERPRDARNAMLLCLLEMKNNYGVDLSEESLVACVPDPTTRAWVLNCVHSGGWREVDSLLSAELAAQAPDPPYLSPWLVLNGYSLASVQEYRHVLHSMICLWYRGPGHDRDKCARCEYEPSHC